MKKIILPILLILILISLIMVSNRIQTKATTPLIKKDNLMSKLYGHWKMVGYTKVNKLTSLKEKVVEESIIPANSNIIITKDDFLYDGLEFKNPRYSLLNIENDEEGVPSSNVNPQFNSLFYEYKTNRPYKYRVEAYSNNTFRAGFEIIDLDTLITFSGGYFLILKKKPIKNN